MSKSNPAPATVSPQERLRKLRKRLSLTHELYRRDEHVEPAYSIIVKDLTAQIARAEAEIEAAKAITQGIPQEDTWILIRKTQ
ncbi:MAG TPA: hypothetical protein VNM48_20695 [Chloroflexota bacterium]|nr:hypothetical protein [Chloroflexota bacterium]